MAARATVEELANWLDEFIEQIEDEDGLEDLAAEERAWRRENGVASDSDEWSDDDDSVEGPDEVEPQPVRLVEEEYRSNHMTIIMS